ncbi:aquaporin-like protein, partial [Pelagophyceae sp. CCMP2097]
LIYAIGHRSGGQINCAVTFGLCLAGKLGPVQGIVNFAAQCIGSIAPRRRRPLQTTLASNVVAPGYDNVQVFEVETIMTFVLVYVVLETATNTKTAANRVLAPLAIGLAVFIGHSILIPIDGCSINPTRSLGPAL